MESNPAVMSQYCERLGWDTSVFQFCDVLALEDWAFGMVAKIAKDFGPDPRLRKLVEHLSDRDIEMLPRGGHDYQKVYAAFKAASSATVPSMGLQSKCKHCKYRLGCSLPR